MSKLSTTVLVAVLLFVLYLVLGVLFINAVKPAWSNYINEQFLKSDRTEASIRKYSNMYGSIAAIIDYFPTCVFLFAQIKLWARYSRLKKKSF